MKNPPIDLKARYLAVNFIGLALIVSVFVSAGVVELIKWLWAPFTGFAPLAPRTLTLLKYIFFLLAAGQFLAIRLVQRVLLARSVDNLPQVAIITLALCESVAVLGLVLFLLGGNPLDFYIFMTVSLLCFYLHYPRYDRWETLWQDNFRAKKKK